MKMKTPSLHLARINVGRAQARLDDSLMSDFVAQLDTINRLAESSSGFVWRLKNASGASGSYVHAYADPLMLVDLSLWESIETLRAFTYRTAHGVSCAIGCAGSNRTTRLRSLFGGSRAVTFLRSTKAMRRSIACGASARPRLPSRSGNRFLSFERLPEGLIDLRSGRWSSHRSRLPVGRHRRRPRSPAAHRLKITRPLFPAPRCRASSS
jgi:Domain of unknown function (DUF3291)